jgi:glycerol-3-phosphate dehydrogenase (NAD(P)+)
MDISVVGAGSWGTALAVQLASNGHEVKLWTWLKTHADQLKADKENKEFLPGVELADSISVTHSLEECVLGARYVLVVVPSHVFGSVLEQMARILMPGATLIWATKGLEPTTGRLLSDVAKEKLGEDIPLAVLSGPTFAMELAKGMPTAVALAVEESADTGTLMQLFSGPMFRVYVTSDLVGVQLGGAVKNVIAVAAGMSDGLGFGANARTALITRGLVEIMRLGEALGANKNTLNGMAGLGDLVLTCTDNQSRNRRFGMALGLGRNKEEVESQIGQVVEGVKAAEEVYNLAKSLDVEMPIVEAVYNVIYHNLSPKQAATRLLSRTPKAEQS